MIKRAMEGETVWFQDISQEDIPPMILPGISFQAKKGYIGIHADGITGAINLANGDTLHILPKIGEVNFFHLLFRSEGFDKNVCKEIASSVTYLSTDDVTLPDIVIKNFFISLDEILRYSPSFKRVLTIDKGNFAKGHIKVTETALNLALHKQPAVTFKFNRREYDTPENRILTEGAIFALSCSEGKHDYRDADIGIEWIKRFPRSQCIMTDLNHISTNMASGKYNGPREYYRKALILAKILLGYGGYALSGATTLLGNSIILNTATIFENYIRKVISAGYSPKGFVVSKGFNSAYSLYLDGSIKICPDIVISNNNDIQLLVDAKYKRPTISDHYQMHTYLSIVGLPRGVIVAPIFGDEPLMTKDFVSCDGKTITEVYLPLKDLDTTEDFLQSLV